MSWGYVAVAAATVAAGVLGGEAQKDAAEEAAKAQTKAAKTSAEAIIKSTQLGIDEQRRQFDEIQAMLAPFVEAGGTSLDSTLALIGLAGPSAQRAAIKQIESGPEFKEMIRQGEEGILQNASATGGLRGGNVQAALAEFRPSVLSSLIDKQYARLGDVIRYGQASAAGTAAAGTTSAGNVTSLLQRQGEALSESALRVGNASAQQALLAGQATQQQYNTAAQGLGMLAALKF